MQVFELDDYVCVEISDPDDPDRQHHARAGRIVGVQADGYDTVTGDPRDGYLYRVRFTDEQGGEMWFRYGDLRHESS